jgi:hypothetical protein
MFIALDSFYFLRSVGARCALSPRFNRDHMALLTEREIFKARRL